MGGGWGVRKRKEDFGHSDKPPLHSEDALQGVAMMAGQEWTRRGGGGGGRAAAVHLFLGAWVVRGGVTGRPELTPPY